MKGGMRDFKLFGEPLGNPIEEIGISDAYDGLPYKSAIHFGENGGYVQKYSKPCVLFSLRHGSHILALFVSLLSVGLFKCLKLSIMPS